VSNQQAQFPIVFALFFVEIISYKAALHQKAELYFMATKSTKRRAWTPENIRTLKTLAKKKTRAASIAKAIKRSEGATRQKAFSLGISLDSRA
jgi:hypothetical protein